MFGQSLDASKYVTSTMLFVYIVIIITEWSGVFRFKTIFSAQLSENITFFYLVVALVVMLAAVEMAQIILTIGSSLMEIISKYLIYSNSYAEFH